MIWNNRILSMCISFYSHKTKSNKTENLLVLWTEGGPRAEGAVNGQNSITRIGKERQVYKLIISLLIDDHIYLGMADVPDFAGKDVNGVFISISSANINFCLPAASPVASAMGLSFENIPKQARKLSSVDSRLWVSAERRAMYRSKNSRYQEWAEICMLLLRRPYLC